MALLMLLGFATATPHLYLGSYKGFLVVYFSIIRKLGIIMNLNEIEGLVVKLMA